MRNILGLFLMCFVSFNAIAQTGGTTFFRTYQVPGRNSTSLNSIEATSDGGYIAIGTSYSPYYLIVLKLDAAGRTLWQSEYAVDGQESNAVSIRETPSGYIAAVALGPAGIDQTLMVMRIGPTGALVWQNTYPSSAGVIPYFAQPTTDGGYLVSASPFASDEYSLWGLKLDDSGGIIWQKTFATYAGLGAIHATGDGGAVVAGGTQSGDAYAGRVVKLDAAGNAEWDRFYTLPFDTFFTSARPTQDGGFIVSGYFITEEVNYTALLMKLDAEGGVTSTFAYSSRSCGAENGYDAQNLVGGGYLFHLASCNSASTRLAKIDESGAILWQRDPTGVFEAAFSPTADGGYIAAGQGADMMGVVKGNAAGGLPPCVQTGSPDLAQVDAPRVVVTDVNGLTENTSTHPEPVVVSGAAIAVTTEFGCTP